MDASCAMGILLLHLCIGAGEASIDGRPGHPTGFWEISAPGWKARWEVSDAIATLNPSVMQEICRNGFCVRYYRKCNVPENPTQCDFRFHLAGRPQDSPSILQSVLLTTPLRIQAEDDASFRFAMVRL